MLKEQEKQELRAYQAKLVMLDENKVKGHLSSQERDKITILLTENHSINSKNIRTQPRHYIQRVKTR